MSAGFALSLAAQGKNVALLSIDPAKRLKTAFGVADLPEEGIEIPLPKGKLVASALQIGDSLKRWVKEEGLSDEAQAKLFSHPLFYALSDKIATSTDTLAAIRVAEWAQKHPELEHLVIDTAPGIHAIDFLAKPEKVMAFLDGKLIEWLRYFVGGEKENLVQRMIKGGARRILDGLAQIGGKSFLLSMGEFCILLDQVFKRALTRLDFARNWIRRPSTEVFLVTSVRDDAVSVALELGRTLSEMKIHAHTAIINRSFPESLLADPGFKSTFENRQERFIANFANYMSSYSHTQDRVEALLTQFSKRVVKLPLHSHLDAKGALRLEDLKLLGDQIV